MNITANMEQYDFIYKFYGRRRNKDFARHLLAIVDTNYDEAKVASDHIPHIALKSQNRAISSATFNTMSLLGCNLVLRIIGENGYACGVIDGAPEQPEHSSRYDAIAIIISRILDRNRGGLALQEFMPFVLTRLFGQTTGDLFQNRLFVDDVTHLKVVVTPSHSGGSFNNGVFAYATKNSNVRLLSATAIVDEWVHKGKKGSKTIGQLVTVTLQNGRQYKVINLHFDRDRTSALATIPLITRLILTDSLILEIVGDFNLPSDLFLNEMERDMGRHMGRHTDIRLESNYDIPPEFQGVDHSFRVLR